MNITRGKHEKSQTTRADVVEAGAVAVEKLQQGINEANEISDSLNAEWSQRIHLKRWQTNALRIGFIISTVISVILFTLGVLNFAVTDIDRSPLALVISAIFGGLLLVDAAGCLAMVVLSFSTYTRATRNVARLTVTSLGLSVVFGFLSSGFSWLWLLFIFQIFCLIVFQLLTDQELARTNHFYWPWERSADEERRDYIPLNFFNLFWVFVVASVIGMLIETVYFLLVFDDLQNRAGILWGPFSPIYGCGAVLMTIALNRYWNRSAVIIFLVAGAIGAAFEFVVSLFLEEAFGIVAWDYSGTFLNIDGRTNFAFFCAWGALGLLWIRIMLPEVLKAVDAIPLKWRAGLTTAFAFFMIANALMTLITIDCWYERMSGQAPSTEIQKFCASVYNDEFMAKRFESMDLDPSRAVRSS